MGCLRIGEAEAGKGGKLGERMMIESNILENIELEFNELRRAINEQNRYNQEMCYLFEQALENIKNGHYEIAMFILCVIIESIGSKQNYEEYKNFDEWLTENPEERLNPFFNEIKENSSEDIIKKWHEQYRETYGPRKNFVGIVIKTYKTLNKYPQFMHSKSEVIGEVVRISYKEYENIEKLWKKFEKVIKDIYDKYRSPFAHQGKMLDSNAIFQTAELGGMSSTDTISIQDIAGIVINVMKVNLK